MAIGINSNIAFSRATASFNRVERDSQIRRARIASGLGITRASDDGGRLVASEGMRAELGGLSQGSRNAENALDLLRSAEGGMNEISGVLIRMREIAVQSANGTLNDKNREALDAEFAQLKEFADRIARVATYNGHSLLSGFGNTVNREASTALAESASTGALDARLFAAAEGVYTFSDSAGDETLTLSNGVTSQTLSLALELDDGELEAGTTTIADFDHLGIQVELAADQVKDASGRYVDGALDGHTVVVESGIGGSFQLGSDAIRADRIEYDILDMTAAGSVLDLSRVSIGTQHASRSAIQDLDGAIGRLARERGSVGAVMNRIEYALDFIGNAIENLQASEATIRDADYAWETSKLARNEILGQGSLAAMVKSRMPTELIMSLLQ